MSFYRNQLEAYLKRINVKAHRVLDLGGASNPIQGRVNSFKSDEYICFDLGVEEAKRSYIKFDINEPLEQLTGFKEEDFKFDTIFCLEVFEYVYNPIEAINNIYRLLDDNGLAYISFPTQYPLHEPKEIDYLRYTRKAIEKYADIFGLEILEIVPRVATEGLSNLSKFYSREGMHPVKHDSSVFDIGYMVKISKHKNDPMHATFES